MSLESRTTVPQEANMEDGSMQADNLVQSTYEVQIKPIDENSPLYSVKSFEELGLPKTILDGIYSMNFSRPSHVQETALPYLMRNPAQNLVGQSQSGTGKTAAFSLNILARLEFQGPMATTPQAMVLAPTRELARQIQEVIQTMGKFMEGLKVQTAIPVEAAQRGQTLDGQVIVGTPGTAFDMIRRKLINVQQVKVLVLDEADNMLEEAMGDQCMRVKNTLPKSTQIVLFSATFPEKVLHYAKKFAPSANELTLKQEELTVEGIRQLYMDCNSEKDKYDKLVKLYGMMTIGSSIIFVRTRESAKIIEQRMTAEGHTVASLTGAQEGGQRDVIIDAFRQGRAKVLIATNVLARGIDVSTVSMVINYDVPDDGRGNPDYQTYLHRIGRTGRFGRIGVSISFVYDQKSFQMLNQISAYYKINLLKLDGEDWDVVEETIQKVLKNPAAQAEYKPPPAGNM